MEDNFQFCDELGPEKIINVYQPDLNLRGILVVDNTAAGPAIGGCRLASDVSTRECFRLARAMTLKNAAAGLPHGGGKSVIFADPHMPVSEKQQIVRAFARSLEDIREYIIGPDMGTNEQAMAWCHDEIGRAVGLPAEIGGIPLDEIGATGFGVAIAAEVVQGFCDLKLQGARVVVQGFGSVGSHAARFLAERGAVLVGASDSRGGTVNPGGLDVESLIAFKAAGNSVHAFAEGNAVDADAMVAVPCDIWIPAARPDVLNADNVERLTAKVIIQGANIPATAEAERIMFERGVINVPDFIANAGGVISAAVEYAGGTRSEAFQVIEEKIRHNTDIVLSDAHNLAVPEREAANQMAEQRVRKAMSLRRWHRD